jgi:hypothetical protein
MIIFTENFIQMKCICGSTSHINPNISLKTIKTTTDFIRTASSIVSESLSSLNISPNKRRAVDELKKFNKKLNYEEVIQ